MAYTHWDMKKPKFRNALQPGQKINWYQITDILGQGGFGITYLAHDENLLQDVAVKEYFPREYAVRLDDGAVEPAAEEHQSDYDWGLSRFISEGRILAQYDHPAIVRVMSVFESNNTAYLVMRYEQGVTLKEALLKIGTAESFEEKDLKILLGNILDGLERMHESCVIHRDIKPDNVFMRKDGTPLLLDFGSARQAMGEKTLDLTTIVSAGYAPIEQYARDEGKQGPWTDIYGLAATCYRAMKGRPPPDALVRSNALINLNQDVIETLADELAGSYSHRFLKAIDHGLAFKPADRPQSIGAWREELRLGDTGEEDIEENRSFVEPSGVMNVAVENVDTGQWEIENLKKEDSDKPDSRVSIEEDYAHFIGDLRRNYYLKSFNTLAARRLGLSWNTAAGLLTWPWLMYRKMYLWAFLIYPLVAGVTFVAVTLALPEILGESGKSVEAVMGGYLLVTTVLGGTFANALYRRHVLARIRMARRLVEDDKVRAQLLEDKGGTSFLLPVLVLGAVAAALAGAGMNMGLI